MNIFDLTPQQLKRAASIKEKLNAINKELRQLLDGSTADGAKSTKKRMSATVKRKIAATQKVRWVKLRRA